MDSQQGATAGITSAGTVAAATGLVRQGVEGRADDNSGDMDGGGGGGGSCGACESGKDVEGAVGLRARAGIRIQLWLGSSCDACKIGGEG